MSQSTHNGDQTLPMSAEKSESVPERNMDTGYRPPAKLYKSPVELTKGESPSFVDESNPKRKAIVVKKKAHPSKAIESQKEEAPTLKSSSATTEFQPVSTDSTSQEPKALEDTSNSPMVYDVQIALWERIHNFSGGIAGIWKALDPRFKYPDNPELEGIKGALNKDKIKYGTFRKQVGRLKKRLGKMK